MNRLIGLLLLLGILASAPTFAKASSLEEFYIYPFVEGFIWKEFDGGKELLKETGPLFGLGAAASIDLHNKALILKAKSDIFGGQVDYDGQTQSFFLDPSTGLVDPTKENRPLKTNVNYIGFRLEGDLGWRFSSAKTSLEPFAGLGYRWWRRDIQGSTSIDTNGIPFPVGSSTEEWQSAYTKVGLRFDSNINPDTRLFAEAGGKYPFYTSNYANPTTVEPKGELSAFAELGMRYKWFRPSLFYEGFKYAKSNEVATGTVVIGGVPHTLAVFQPESESHIFGLNLGIAFR